VSFTLVFYDRYHPVENSEPLMSSVTSEMTCLQRTELVEAENNECEGIKAFSHIT